MTKIFSSLRCWVIIFLTFISISYPVSAQQQALYSEQDSLSDVERLADQIKRVVRFGLYTPHEKVYLHLDNNAYYKGETIYFKAYVFRADTGRKTDLSHVLYADLITPNGDIVDTRKLKITDGMAEGDFKLDRILVTGFYEVRAYTRYMTNWGTEACFSRVIPVFKAPKEPGNYGEQVLDKFSFRHRLPDMRQRILDGDETNAALYKSNAKGSKVVRFYPEGGNLVKGLKSRVAYVVTEDGKETERNIMTVTAVEGENKALGYQLPTPLSEGIVLKMDAVEGDMVSVHVDASEGFRNTLIGYALMHDGSIRKADTLCVRGGWNLELKRSELPDGVNQLTFFSAQGRILAERLFFIYPHTSRTDSIQIHSLTQTLSPCCKVSFDIQATPGSHLSFSAMDAATLSGDRKGSMMTHLLLASEVRGYIENPDYYFESDDMEHRREADLLMMVQGWRRYDWQVMGGLEPRGKVQPIENQLSIMGSLIPKKKKLNVNNTQLKAYLYNQQGHVFDGEFTTDELGEYLFTLPDIEDEWVLLMQAKQNEKNANFLVGIDRHFSPEKRFIAYEETTIKNAPEANFSWEENFKDSDSPLLGNGYVLPTVKVKERRVLGDLKANWYDESTARLHSPLFYDCDKDADMYSDQGIEIPTLYEWLAMKSAMFDNRPLLSVIDSTMSTYTAYHEDGPLYNNRSIIWIVDGHYYTTTNTDSSKWAKAGVYATNNENHIIDMPVFLDEVKSVYITEDITSLNQYILANDISALNPVIIFVFSHPTRGYKVKGLRRTHFQGFNTATTFAMEDYSKLPPMPDYRRTLYWAPTVTTSNDGHATVEFYNNSSCRSMYISAEGISPSGRFLVK